MLTKALSIRKPNSSYIALLQFLSHLRRNGHKNMAALTKLWHGSHLRWMNTAGAVKCSDCHSTCTVPTEKHQQKIPDPRVNVTPIKKYTSVEPARKNIPPHYPPLPEEHISTRWAHILLVQWHYTLVNYCSLCHFQTYIVRLLTSLYGMYM